MMIFENVILKLTGPSERRGSERIAALPGEFPTTTPDPELFLKRR